MNKIIKNLYWDILIHRHKVDRVLGGKNYYYIILNNSWGGYILGYK